MEWNEYFHKYRMEKMNNIPLWSTWSAHGNTQAQSLYSMSKLSNSSYQPIQLHHNIYGLDRHDPTTGATDTILEYNASNVLIKNQYKYLSLVYHPDRQYAHKNVNNVNRIKQHHGELAIHILSNVTFEMVKEAYDVRQYCCTYVFARYFSINTYGYTYSTCQSRY